MFVFLEEGLQALRQAIKEQGRGLGTDIVQVGSFLNHRLDTRLLFGMGAEIADHFREDGPSLVMTVEASGIALALATAHALGGVPVLFTKKNPAKNQNEAMYETQVASYTKGTPYTMRCAQALLPKDARVLIVDDFLARGEAVRGMLDLVSQAGARAVGVAVAIEKGFQEGGRQLREAGVKLLSLSVVREIKDGQILLQDD